MRILSILYLLLGMLACNPSISKEYLINAGQLESMMKDTPGMQLVDLRTPGELQRTGRINGAINIDFEGDNFESQLSQIDPKKPTIIYCKAGNRSAQAFPIMQQAGFKQLYMYPGGIDEWKSKGKPTVK